MSRRSGSASRTRGAAASSRDTGPTLFDTTMCSASERATLPPSTSSAAGSRARTCRQQGAELVSRVREAVCGGSSRESFASWHRESSSWRTSQLSLLEDLTRFSGAFARAGTMQSGRACALPMLVLHTAGTDSLSSRGAWPTPCAILHNDGEDPAQWLARAEALKAKHHNGNGAGMPLAVAARLWPTATCGDAIGSGSRNTATSKAHPGISLTDAVLGDGGKGRWPTPAATDHKGSYAPGQRRGQLPDAVQCHGRLNADWVEALMGFPAGWTRTAGPSGPESSSPTESRRESPTSAESERSG